MTWRIIWSGMNNISDMTNKIRSIWTATMLFNSVFIVPQVQSDNLLFVTSYKSLHVRGIDLDTSVFLVQYSRCFSWIFRTLTLALWFNVIFSSFTIVHEFHEFSLVLEHSINLKILCAQFGRSWNTRCVKRDERTTCRANSNKRQVDITNNQSRIIFILIHKQKNNR